jgi:MFS family permease
MAMAMSASEIAQERRRGRVAGIAAIAGGVLFPVGLLLSGIANKDRPEHNTAAQLRYFHRHAGELVASSVVRSVGLALLVLVSLHLYRATKARNPGLSSVVAVVGVFGPLASAIGSLAHDVYLAIASADFAGRQVQTIHAAKDLSESPFALVTIGLGIAGTLALAFWFVIGSVTTMRVGLLTRFMGVLGVIIGPAFLLGLAYPVVAFWLIAIGVLLLGRWPRGLPPAWRQGEAVPWPSMAREEEEESSDAAPRLRNGEVNAVGPAVRKAEPEEAAAGETRSRRKRKRRR